MDTRVSDKTNPLDAEALRDEGAARARFEASVQLQTDFNTVENYVRYCKAVSEGRFRLFKATPSPLMHPPPGEPVGREEHTPEKAAADRARFEASPQIQSEFGTVGAYERYCRDMRTGRIHFCGGTTPPDAA